MKGQKGEEYAEIMARRKANTKMALVGIFYLYEMSLGWGCDRVKNKANGRK